MLGRSSDGFRGLLVPVLEWVLGRPLRLREVEDPVATGRLAFGRHSYGIPNVLAYAGDPGKVVVGSFVAIAQDIEIFVGGNHRTDWVSTFPFRMKLGLSGAMVDGVPATKGDVTIGNDVWIGRGTTILSGVSVGHGAVIGARAVVAKDVRPYAIVVGNPAREVRRRFNDDQVQSLLDIAWWDWPIADIEAAVPFLSSTDIEPFIARYYPRRHFPADDEKETPSG